jgi:carbon monoxide dehydrogenase subunit G
MADYHFVTTHEIQAPMEQVWDALRDLTAYPTWQTHVVQAQLIESSGPDGVGDKTRLTVKGRLPFTLTIDITVTQADPPRTLEVRSLGELQGVGRFTLSQHEATTTARYTWNVRTTKRWMNLLAPLARPFFERNHNGVMRKFGQDLARLLGARLISIEVGSGPTPTP